MYNLNEESGLYTYRGSILFVSQRGDPVDLFQKAAVRLLSALIISAIVPGVALASDDTEVAAASREANLLQIARKIIERTPTCALITLGTDGWPNVRTMDPFLPDSDMIVRFGTNPKSRKVSEIKRNPRVTIFYEDPAGAGYVSIKGSATLQNDPEKKAAFWKEEWDAFYTDRVDGYLLIEVKPITLEVLSFGDSIFYDPKTWDVPTIQFPSTEPESNKPTK